MTDMNQGVNIAIYSRERTLLACDYMQTKKTNRGLKARWPEVQERVHRWVLEQRTAKRGLSTVKLRLNALVLAK